MSCDRIALRVQGYHDIGLARHFSKDVTGQSLVMFNEAGNLAIGHYAFSATAGPQRHFLFDAPVLDDVE